MNHDTRYRDALLILRELEARGFEARLAGGCVRDRLMGVVPTDYDIVTSATPDQVLEAMKHYAHKVIPTGIAHGTVMVLAPSTSLEITTLRKDVATDGRRAVVAFGAGFEEDSLRRDFTINGLFEDQHGKVYDYVDGISDLNQKILRFVGDPTERIKEDALRILRFFRFWSRLGFTPAPGTLEALPPLTPNLKLISQERITAEIWQIFQGNFFVNTVPALAKTKTMEQVDLHLNFGITAFAQFIELNQYKIPSSYQDSIGKLLMDRSPYKPLGIAAWMLLCSFQSHEDLDLWKWGTHFKIKNRDKKILRQAEIILHGIREFSKETDETVGFRLDDLRAWALSTPNFVTFYLPILRAVQALSVSTGPKKPKKHAVDFTSLDSNLAKAQLLSERYHEKIHGNFPLNGTDIQTSLNMNAGGSIGMILQKARHAWYQNLWATQDGGIQWILNHRDLWDPHGDLSPIGDLKKNPNTPTN
jgi:tRNA nucleotidyltransferase/poly(A) polymerase